jgi:hypothetical protein
MRDRISPGLRSTARSGATPGAMAASRFASQGRHARDMARTARATRSAAAPSRRKPRSFNGR